MNFSTRRFHIAGAAALLALALVGCGSNDTYSPTVDGGGQNITSFTLNATPESVTVAPGGTATYTVTITPTSGSVLDVTTRGKAAFDVTLAVSGGPAGLIKTFTPPTVNIASGTATSTLTVQVPEDVALDQYTLTVSGTGLGQTKTDTVGLNVTSGGASQGPFTVVVNPDTLTANSNTVTTTVTITPLQGFDVPVTLSAEGIPAGTTASFSPATVPMNGTTAQTSTLTISNLSEAPMQHYTFSVLGRGGSYLAGDQATLMVHPTAPSFTVKLEPFIRFIDQAYSAQYLVTVTPYGGFEGVVDLSTVLPSRLISQFQPTSVTISGTTPQTSTLRIDDSSPSGAASIDFLVKGQSGAKVSYGAGHVEISNVAPN